MKRIKGVKRLKVLNGFLNLFPLSISKFSKPLRVTICGIKSRLVVGVPWKVNRVYSRIRTWQMQWWSASMFLIFQRSHFLFMHLMELFSLTFMQSAILVQLFHIFYDDMHLQFLWWDMRVHHMISFWNCCDGKAVCVCVCKFSKTDPSFVNTPFFFIDYYLFL